MQPSHFCWPHLPLDFHFSCPRARAICFDCGLQNSTDKTNLPQSIRSLEINQTFYVLLFRKLFRQMLSSEEEEKSGRKRREEGRGQSRRHQRHMSGISREIFTKKIRMLFAEISPQMTPLVPNGDK